MTKNKIEITTWVKINNMLVRRDTLPTYHECSYYNELKRQGVVPEEFGYFNETDLKSCLSMINILQKKDKQEVLMFHDGQHMKHDKEKEVAHITEVIKKQKEKYLKFKGYAYR